MTPSARPTPVYLDCDTGVDDALALALLLASPEADLVGVGTVSGNTGAEQAAANTLALLALAGRAGVPVAVGAGNASVPVPHIHGANGLGDVLLPASGESPAAESAAELLIGLSHTHAGRLHVVAVGPLTNLATALELDGTLPERVASVTVMGGAARSPGNITAVAEANIGNDPEAARRVFAAPWDITLVPLDVTLVNRLTEDDRRRLEESGRPVARTLGLILNRYFDFYVSVYGLRCAALHDPLAAALAIGCVEPLLAPRVSVTIDDTHGPGRGQTICDLRGQWRDYPEQPGVRSRVVLSTTQPLAPILMERLLAL
ncbi:inosine-uridine nucleoside N-ribohydrolase [Sphaerisporangium krabiense]|uniref:Purine nucleosidase n=1 Tax=Sphaerisporangium krabiense TaxID=763782 RepID=A0A7W8Z250_9ACTN|nr:nucleoside hydrolase [Sphaerisporangium krabiense]MBB5626073.1 purine nucleosidase [Sphaerisporangium krabiense]GII64877.1 inosine-uridine nucleoside N-ribohydrolase [Sphaerisporangium krabiense]